MIISTTQPMTTTMRSTITAYADKMEDTTGWTIELAYDSDEEEFNFYLIDLYGERDGDPWTSFEDLVFDTEDYITAE